MTITRLWQAGFEAGNTNEISGVGGNVAGVTASSGDSYTGSYSLRTYAISTNTSWATKSFTATNQMRCGFWLKGNNSSATKFISFVIVDTAGGHCVQLDISTVNGVADLYVLAVYRDQMTTWSSDWQHIGIDFKVDASAGWCNVYVDGVLAMEYSGNTGSVSATALSFGKLESFSHTSDFYHDDMYIDDTTGEAAPAAPPVLRFYPLFPDGTGTYSQWTGSDGDSTDNYALVDEVPSSSTDYILSATADQIDSYTTSTISLFTGQRINAVIPTAEIRKIGATAKIALGTRLGSTDSVGSDKDLYSSNAPISERQTTKPGGGAWTQSDLDSVEILIKSRGTY